MSTRPSRHGFTILELLLAGAILSVMLAALGALFAGTNRAYTTNEAVSADVTRLRGAIQALRNDLALAGYCGVGEHCPALTDPLSIDVAATDAACRAIEGLHLAYVEDRFSGGTAITRSVAFRLAGDRLERREDDGAYVAIADGIHGFEFCGYRARSDADGALRFTRPEPGDLLSVELRLRYQRAGSIDAERFAATAPNTP